MISDFEVQDFNCNFKMSMKISVKDVYIQLVADLLGINNSCSELMHKNHVFDQKQSNFALYNLQKVGAGMRREELGGKITNHNTLCYFSVLINGIEVYMVQV